MNIDNERSMEQGLDWVVDKNIKTIILGTFPSIKSRDICYYNHPQNLFWSIIAEAFNHGKPLKTKEDRYRCLLQKHIGLWDVIKQCEFEEKSSLDSKIIKESIIFNDFEKLRKFCPNLSRFIFSSRNAELFFRRYQKCATFSNNLKKWLNDDVIQMTLPSTSPANARLKKDKKIEIWLKTLNNIQKEINPQKSER